MLDSTPIASTGLCMTCNNIPECGFRKLRGFDAQFCELFDTYSQVRTRVIMPGNGKGGKLSNYPHAGSDFDKSQNNQKGLCYNCEHRTECRLIKPDGGVWHCEEYE